MSKWFASNISILYNLSKILRCQRNAGAANEEKIFLKHDFNLELHNNKKMFLQMCWFLNLH